MTVDEVRERIAEIKVYANELDDETAHSREDELRDDVLTAIASGAPNAAELAREVLKARELSFARYCV